MFFDILFVLCMFWVVFLMYVSYDEGGTGGVQEKQEPHTKDVGNKMQVRSAAGDCGSAGMHVTPKSTP